jgi:sulfonate transport system substrate-binding protein
MRKKHAYLGLIVVLLIIFFAYFINKYSNKTIIEKIRIGIALQPASALLICAWKKGFFAKEGLDVEVATYPSGKRCLQDGILKDKVDVGDSGDIPFVISSASRKDIKIICSICTSGSIQKIIARKDRGILKPTDLKSKKIGTQKGSIVHYFLDRFLIFNMIPSDSIHTVYFKAEKLPGALADGEIDAFSMREPFISMAAELIPENYVIFEEENANINYDLLIAKEDYLKNNRNKAIKLIRALLKTEKYIRNNPLEAQKIVSETLGASLDEIRSMWSKNQFSIFLGQSLLTSLDECMFWAEKDGLVINKEDDVDYRKRIDYSLLETVNKNRITIIR